MTKTGKLAEYRDYIGSLNAISSYEVYLWMITLGKKLKEEPLEETGEFQKTGLQIVSLNFM